MAKSVKSIFSSLMSKNVALNTRNTLGIQRFYLSSEAQDSKREEFRLEYLDGPQEGISL